MKKILENSIKELKFLLPIFFIATFIGNIIELWVPNSIISDVLNKNIYVSIPLAALLGILLPIPRYATYPIAFALFLKGAGYGVVFALIGGEVICESIARDIMEIKYLGTKFFLLRMILSIIFISLGGYIMEVLL